VSTPPPAPPPALIPGEPAAGALPAAPEWPAERPDRLGDLRLGLRLAVTGRRSGWPRIALVAAGIGAVVAALLLAASIGPARAAQQERYAASTSVSTPVPGVDPLYRLDRWDPYAGRLVKASWVRAGGPRAPLPPGVDRLPGPGETVFSPALARLLAAPEGALLRPRYPGRVIGTVGPAGLVDGPADLVAYVGSADLAASVGSADLAASVGSADLAASIGSADLAAEPVYGFGAFDPAPEPLPPLLGTLVTVGAVVLLFPLLVLVAAVSRLSARDRRRRLAALRLVGAGAGQVRRIAAGEALAGALLGLAVGAGLFLAARPLVGRPAFTGVAGFAGVRPFPADVVPAWPLAVLIAVGVPALAVLATLVALRGTLAEPLGTLREATAPARRLLWRLLPAAAGATLLAIQARRGSDELPGTDALVATGSVLLLAAVPALLPWLLERVVRRPWGGTPALQLAARRLRADSGSPARLVAGLTVTLAGAIALGTLLAAADDRYDPAPAAGWAPVTLTAADPALAARVRAVPGVTAVHEVSRVGLVAPSGAAYTLTVAPCAVLRRLATLPSCVDGRMYGADVDLPRGGTLPVTDLRDGAATRHRLALPAARGAATGLTGPEAYTVLATPGAVRAVPAELVQPLLDVRYDRADPGVLDRVRAATGPAGWHARTGIGAVEAPGSGAVDYPAVRAALLAGALLTLSLGAAAFLVLGLAQVRDTRRPLAALTAAGLPRSVLARSVGWHSAVPVLLGVLVADAAGLALAGLLMPIADVRVRTGWPLVAGLDAAALAVVAVATVLVLPAVRTATRPDGLRTE
jgi:hypothetical protein